MVFGVTHLGRLEMSFLIIILWNHTVRPLVSCEFFLVDTCTYGFAKFIPNIIFYIISRQDILETYGAIYGYSDH